MRIKPAALAASVLIAETVAAAPAYKPVSVEDFFLDRKAMLGQRVQIGAQFQVKGDFVFIVLDGGRNATFVIVDSIPRDHRKALSRQCAQPCSGTITGKVSRVPGDVGITADDIVLN